jgi:hypothetical protein
LAAPIDQIAVPRTEADRLVLLGQLHSDLQELVGDFRQGGLNVRGTQPELSDFSFDSKQGCLTAHAKSGGCRVHLYLSGIFDGQEMVPIGVADVTGTCNEYRRRRMCLHTLAAVNRLSAALRDKGHPLRQRLFRLTSQDRWRESLKLVDQFLVNQPMRPAEEVQPELRIAWRVEFETKPMAGGASRLMLGVVPFEQKIGKNGRWTKGRRLSVAALNPNDTTLSEVDRRIGLKFVQQQASYRYGYSPYGGYRDYLDPFDVLEELVGYPLVFWGDRPEVSVEVARGQFGLFIEEHPAGWVVKPAFDGQVRHDECVWQQSGQQFEKPIWIDRSGNRVVVCPTKPALVTLVAKLSAIDEPIPPDGQAALLEKLARLQSQLPVVLPASCAGGSEAADGRIVLRMTPEPGGTLRAEMVVAPAADGAEYAPGGGPAAIAVLRDGKQFQFLRSLADERRRAGDIDEGCAFTSSGV